MKGMNDYQKTITVSKPAYEVYNAITEHIADWWSNDLAGAAAHAGDSFSIAFGKTQKTFAVVEATPGKQIVWECTKAYIANPSLSNKSEWLGTRIYWTLNTSGESTLIDFRHEGLNPAFECYTLCESGWEQFLGSLQGYISTGKGLPYKKAD
jgi:uncharacterized protein YndB with AHSA1/START domain